MEEKVKEVIAEAGIVSKDQEESPDELSGASELITKFGKDKFYASISDLCLTCKC